MIKSISFKRLLLAGLFVFCASFDVQAIPFNFGGNNYNLYIAGDGTVRYFNHHHTGIPALDAAFIAQYGPAAVHGVFRKFLPKLATCEAIAATTFWGAYHYVQANLSTMTQEAPALVADVTPGMGTGTVLAGTALITTLIWHYLHR